MGQKDKDVVNKIPIYKLKTTKEVMKYYDGWGDKYDQEMVDWNYTGPKETVNVLIKYTPNKKIRIYDAGCGTGLVGIELKKYDYLNIDGADLSEKLLDLVPKGYYKNLEQTDLNKPIAIIMGSEDKGVSKSVLNIVDHKAALPLKGQVNSLNVSVACGTILYEIVRQKNH